MTTENEQTTQVQVVDQQPTEQQQEQEQQRQDAQEADSALEAGFKETRGETPVEAPAKTETVAPDSADAKDDKADAATGDTSAAETPAAKPAVKIAGRTEEELTALLDKVPGLDSRVTDEIRKVYGKFGELQGTLQRLQQGQTSRKFEAAALKRLNAEFPEIASMLAEDLSEIYSSAPAAETKPNDKADDKATSAADVEARIAASVDAAVAKVREETERKLLTVMHPDWLEVCKTPRFAEFLKTLPEADRTKYLESNDAIVSAKAFALYKAWNPKPQKPSAKKQERLEAAITPAGGASIPATTLDDEAAFVSGFKSERSG